MKYILIFSLLLAAFNVDAVKVDTNQSAALVNPQLENEWSQQQQGIISILSMKSGLDFATIENKFTVDESFKRVILRDYFERLPDDFSTDLQWYNLTVDDVALHQLMITQRIPIWPDQRGRIYVWLVEEGQDFELRHADSNSAANYWLERWFKVLGVPVQFYNPSAEDLLSFEPRDVRFLEPDLIEFIQANNDIEHVLLVFLKNAGNGYSFRYGLAADEQPITIKNLQFLDLASGMLSLAKDVQKKMASDQRLYPDEFIQSTASIIINDINGADQMLRLIDYLDKHALIDAYLINQSKGKQVQIMVELRVLPDTFVTYVENEGVLRHQPLNVGSSILFKFMQ